MNRPVSLRSFNLPDHFVRHGDFLGELSPVVSDLDRQDATFEMTAGMAPAPGVSFLSCQWASFALRHQDFRVKLHEFSALRDDAPLFRNDATFVQVPGLADQSLASFRSLNFPDRFLRHRDFHLFVEPPSGPDDQGFAGDATFKIDTPLASLPDFGITVHAEGSAPGTTHDQTGAWVIAEGFRWPPAAQVKITYFGIPRRTEPLAGGFEVVNLDGRFTHRKFHSFFHGTQEEAFTEVHVWATEQRTGLFAAGSIPASAAWVAL